MLFINEIDYEHMDAKAKYLNVRSLSGVKGLLNEGFVKNKENGSIRFI